MNLPADRLLEFQRQLYALADQLEAEAAKLPPSPSNWQVHSRYREIGNQYIEVAFGILIDVYLLGGFQADPKWRTILAISRKMARGTRTWFNAILNTLYHNYGFRCQLRSWQHTIFKTEVAVVRLVASRILLSPMAPEMRKNRRRYRI